MRLTIKIILVVIGITILSQHGKGQIVIPVEDRESYHKTLKQQGAEDYPDFVHFKDLNNLRDIYLGFWEGSKDGKKYTIDVRKSVFEMEDSKEDAMNLRFKVVDERTGDVLDNTLSFPDGHPRVSSMLRFDQYLRPTFNYVGMNYGCGESGTLFLIHIESTSELDMIVIPDRDLISSLECPDLDKVFEWVMPTEDEVILTKVSGPLIIGDDK